MSWQRPDNRQPMRAAIRFEREFIRFAAGSVLTSAGDTQVVPRQFSLGCLSFRSDRAGLANG